MLAFRGRAIVAILLSISVAYPEVFKGDIYIGGAETWEGDVKPDKLEAMKQNRYVFLTGSDDFNRRMVRKAAAEYEAAGIESIELKIIAHHGHDLPTASIMSDALNFLDAVLE